MGDLDGDGAADLVVVANLGSGDVSVLMNLGDGTFAETRYAAGRGPTSVAVGDLNGDGAADLVVAEQRLWQQRRLGADEPR